MLTAIPRILGIVNITEDSFSDGGLYLDTDRAVSHAARLIADGAYAVDLGPASSHPDAKKVQPVEEIRRLRPVVEILKEKGARISVDSFQPDTQLFAMEAGVDYLNDIEGFAHPEIYDHIAESGCELILMHSIQRRGIATRVQSDPDTILDSISSFFEQRIQALQNAGVARERIILDPGMGFFLGTNPEVSVRVLQGIQQLKHRFDLPVLISVSRKSFLRTITGSELAGINAATLAAEIYASLQQADYIRTHNVKSLADGLKVLDVLAQIDR